jgi:hypothetical protein
MPRVLWLAPVVIFLANAPARGQNAPTLIVEPGASVLSGSEGRQQITVTLRDPAGGLRDVTRQARFSLAPSGIAAIGTTGVVTPLGDGQATLRAQFEDLACEVPFRVERSAESSAPSYRLDVAPMLSKAGCNMGACHGNINGKGGFRLSLRNDDPSFDFDSLTRDALGRRIDRTDPARSLAFLKPAGLVVHEGGRRFSADSPEAKALIGWVAAGSVDDKDRAPRLVRLKTWPGDRLVSAPCLSQQLIVTAEFSDGSTHDVTRQAAYDVSEPTKVQVSPDGLVAVTAPGEAVVSVRYGTGRGTVRLAFLADRPAFAWDGPHERTPLDAAVFAKLKQLKVRPSPLVDDATFLRRLSLDTLGVLPTPEEVRAFLADQDPEKRSRWVDRVLQRDEFADFWALKWADLLRNEEKAMGEKGAWIFQRWLRDQFAADRPLDEFARDLITGRGSTWRNPAASFHRTNRDPQAAAEAVSQVFLGVRLQCARCHNHPFDVWTQDDYYGLAATFANLGRKTVNNVRRDSFDKHEINGDEIVYLDGKAQLAQPRSGQMMGPKALGGPALDVRTDPNALDDLADWVTRDNPQFVRNLANRVWAHLMGRGVVDPVDDFRESNPPSNPALLDALADAFKADGMRLRPLVRMILSSSVYQLAARPDPTSADDESNANFAHATVKLLPAEVLLDAIGQALGAPESFSNAPPGSRATQLAGVKAGGEFLRVFGKPERLLTCECERSEATTLAQAFQLINGEAVRRKLTAEDNRVGQLLKAGVSDEAVLDDLYLATLSRLPTDQEREALLEHVAAAHDRRKAWEDTAWALLNSKEFLLRH